MRNTSFFEKLTGSIRLSDDDLNALSEPEDKTENPSKNIKSSKHTDGDFEIIEGDDEFELPEDAEIETIEEIIEDDTIDEEEVEEYYEEIIDEDEEEDVELKEDDTKSLINDLEDAEEDEVENESELLHLDENYPVYHLPKNEDVNSKELEEIEKKEAHKQIELPVDVFELHNEVVLRILVPGITPENLKVSITRDHVSLTCTRGSPEGIKETSYFEREIPYGDFTRMIHLPSDVDVERAEAVEKYGLLIIRLPMLDAKKVQELKIKSV